MEAGSAHPGQTATSPHPEGAVVPSTHGANHGVRQPVLQAEGPEHTGHELHQSVLHAHPDHPFPARMDLERDPRTPGCGSLDGGDPPLFEAVHSTAGGDPGTSEAVGDDVPHGGWAAGQLHGSRRPGADQEESVPDPHQHRIPNRGRSKGGKAGPGERDPAPAATRKEGGPAVGHRPDAPLCVPLDLPHDLIRKTIFSGKAPHFTTAPVHDDAFLGCGPDGVSGLDVQIKQIGVPRLLTALDRAGVPFTQADGRSHDQPTARQVFDITDLVSGEAVPGRVVPERPTVVTGQTTVRPQPKEAAPILMDRGHL